MSEPTQYKYRVHCTHHAWVGKPDPSGFGKFTYDTDAPRVWIALQKARSVAGICMMPRIDRIEDLTHE